MESSNIKLNLLDSLNEVVMNLSILMGKSLDREEFNEAKKYAKGLDKIYREFNIGYNNGASYLVEINIKLNCFEEASKWFKIYCEDVLINNWKKSDYFNKELLENMDIEEIRKKEAKWLWEKEYKELEEYKAYKNGKVLLKKYLEEVLTDMEK